MTYSLSLPRLDHHFHVLKAINSRYVAAVDSDTFVLVVQTQIEWKKKGSPTEYSNLPFDPVPVLYHEDF